MRFAKQSQNAKGRRGAGADCAVAVGGLDDRFRIIFADFGEYARSSSSEAQSFSNPMVGSTRRAPAAGATCPSIIDETATPVIIFLPGGDSRGVTFQDVNGSVIITEISVGADAQELSCDHLVLSLDGIA